MFLHEDAICPREVARQRRDHQPHLSRRHTTYTRPIFTPPQPIPVRQPRSTRQDRQ